MKTISEVFGAIAFIFALVLVFMVFYMLLSAVRELISIKDDGYNQEKTMSEETKKPITGSNEHFAEIEKSLAKIYDLETRVAALSDSYHGLIAENMRLVDRIAALETVNPAG
jgi:uncharacterized protein YoxC